MQTPATSIHKPVLWVAASAILINVLKNWETLTTRVFIGNDDLMRIVQVRDWLGGQPWSDLHQYRMGVGPATVMHWSRHIDVLLGSIIAPLTPLVGQAKAELVAAIVLPLALLTASLFLVALIAEHLGGKRAVLPSLLAFAAHGSAVIQFRVGRVDHHGLVIVLTLASIALLLRGTKTAHTVLAGALAGIALTVGLEATAVVTGLMVTVGLIYVTQQDFGPQTRGFFLALPASAGISTLAFGARGRLTASACDVFGSPSFIPLVVIGVLIAGLVTFAPKRPGRRFLGLAFAGVVGAGVLIRKFPQCLKGPYEGVDPWLRENWLANVSEVRNIAALWESSTVLTVTWILPTMVMVATLVVLFKTQRETKNWVLAPTLILAIMMALFQARGIPIVLAIGAPLIGVATLRIVAKTSLAEGIAAPFLSAMIAVVLSGSLVPALNVFPSFASQSSPNGCISALRMMDWGSIPQGSLVISNLDHGPDILYYHPTARVVGAAYHRNNAGNLLSFSTSNDPIQQSEATLRSEGINIVLLCSDDRPGSPDSLDAALRDGQVPDYLQQIESPDLLLVFEVLPER